jgi:hypothetical protein
MPPSAMIGSASPSAARHSTSACSCGTPKLVVRRVGTPAAGPDADLHGTGAAVREKARAFARRDVAGDHVHVGKSLPDLAERPVHHRRMSVRDIDDEHVHAGTKQLGGALQVVAAGADRGADPQPALRVSRGEGLALLVRMSREVIRPSRRPSPSTSGSFLTLCAAIRRRLLPRTPCRAL